MTLPLYPDGCVIPNIPTKHFLVYLAPKCEHGRVRGACIAIDAESADDALIYVGRNVRLGKLEAVSVIEVPEYSETASIAS